MNKKHNASFVEKLAIHKLLETVIVKTPEGAVYEKGWTDARVLSTVQKAHPNVTLGSVCYLRADVFGSIARVSKRVAGASKDDIISRLDALEAWARSIDLGFKG